jgi:polysaccharide deacetylase 2 family uncharacterized protein YibQ
MFSGIDKATGLAGRPPAYVIRKLAQVFCLLCLAPPAALAESGVNPAIAIIIDDMGNTQELSERAVRLPAPVTYAFLPDLRYTAVYAEMAHQRGHEIMLHAPMENHKNLPLGPMALTSLMDTTTLSATLRTAIRSIPHISGVNNHMGSLLTEDRLAMSTVMNEVGQHPLYFVDSRTTANTVAQRVAELQGIPTLARDVFLDHVISYRAIHLQFMRLIDIARKNGTAIAIGHPHPETLQYLEDTLPRLGEQGISVATVKGIWAIRNQGRPMFDVTPSPRSAILAHLKNDADAASQE